MALNKAKVLKSAEKYVIHGKISHAISEYQKLIKEDPTDLPLVNTLGDLYVRLGNIPEAVKCFTRLAESYDNGGFVVRAIAMYKKVSKIDPAQVQSLTRLADLYLRQGLNSDARAHYLLVADNLIRKGDPQNAIIVLERIIEIDPENPSVDARLAEVYHKTGKKDEAVRSFHSAGQKSRKRGSYDDAEGYFRKALELDQNNVKVLLSSAEILSELGKTDQALSLLNSIPLHDFKPEVLETSFQINLKSERVEEAEKAAAQLLELDNHYFRLYSSLADFFLSKGNVDNAVAQIAKVTDIAVERNDGATVESQLKAIHHENPSHTGAILALIKYYTLSNSHQYVPGLLEKLGNVYIHRDELAEAASVYVQLVKLEPGDPVHRENLRQIQERLGLGAKEIELPRLAPDMSSIADKFISEPTIQTIASDETAAEEEEEKGQNQKQELIKGFVVEGDLFASYGLYEKAIEQYQRVIALIPSHIEIHEKIRDMYAKSGELVKAAQECLVLANIYTARNDSENANRNFTLAYQYDPSLHQKPIYKESIDQDSMAQRVPSEVGPTVDPKRLREVLQEVDFYLDLGFLSEAKNSIDQFLKLAPADSEFDKRLERYQSLLKAQSGQESEVSVDEVAPTEPVGASNEIKIEEFETTAVPLVENPASPLEVRKAEGFETTSVVESPSAKVESSSAAESVESFDEMMIDLDQELEESSLESSSVPVSTEAKPQKSPNSRLQVSEETSGLEDVFQEFKEEVEDESESGDDYETHYNLGIAFKEMGLIEESIGEFQKALKSHSQDSGSEEVVKCCNMLGLCFVEKGLPQVAIKWFNRGLATPGHHEETYQALRYDLACAHELAGNLKSALETFLDVYGININYRDVAEKIENLKNRTNG